MVFLFLVVNAFLVMTSVSPIFVSAQGRPVNIFMCCTITTYRCSVLLITSFILFDVFVVRMNTIFFSLSFLSYECRWPLAIQHHFLSPLSCSFSHLFSVFIASIHYWHLRFTNSEFQVVIRHGRLAMTALYIYSIVQ